MSKEFTTDQITEILEIKRKAKIVEYQRFEGYEESEEILKCFKDENEESYKHVLDYDVASLRLKDNRNL